MTAVGETARRPSRTAPVPRCTTTATTTATPTSSSSTATGRRRAGTTAGAGTATALIGTGPLSGEQEADTREHGARSPMVQRGRAGGEPNAGPLRVGEQGDRLPQEVDVERTTPTRPWRGGSG